MRVCLSCLVRSRMSLPSVKKHIPQSIAENIQRSGPTVFVSAQWFEQGFLFPLVPLTHER